MISRMISPWTSVSRMSRPENRTVSFLWSMPEQVQDRRVQVVDINFVFHDFVTVIIGGTVNHSALHASAGEPEGKAEGIMIAAVGALGEGRAPEFSRPQDQCLVQQTARLQVTEQAGDGLVHGAGIVFMTRLQTAMLIPAVGAAGCRAGEFNEPHAALH